MRKKILLLIALMVFLAACSPAAPGPADPPVANSETDVPAVTERAQEPAPSEQPDEANAAGDPLIFQIMPGDSQVRYEVGEVFLDQNNRFNVAIGITSQVTGEISVDRSSPQDSSLGAVSVDISQFTSDNTRRDNAIRDRFLESSRFPTATFTATSIDGLPATLQEGVDIPLTISGDLTIREATRLVTFDAVVRLEGDLLSGEASTQILMSDFGFGPINIAGILKTEDEVKVTLKFIARPVS